MTDQSMNLSQSFEAHGEMLENLEQQLIALYEEKQQASKDVAEMATMRECITNLEAQLVELYREKEELRGNA